MKVDGQTIYHCTEYRERRNHFAYFHSKPTGGFDTDRESFIGLYNSFADPQAVVAGSCTNSVAQGWSPIAAHQVDLTLEPGEVKDMVRSVVMPKTLRRKNGIVTTT